MIIKSKKRKNFSLLKAVFGASFGTFFCRFTIIVQFIIIVLLLNPQNLINEIYKYQAIKAIQDNLKSDEVNPILSVIGYDQTIPSVETLKSQNIYLAEVYKDAQNGDVAIGFEKRTIIYRPGNGKIIYDGPSPSQLFEQHKQKLTTEITKLAITNNILAAQPNYAAVNITIVDNDNFATFKNIPGEIYKLIEIGDVIATYYDLKVQILYRPNTKNIIYHMKY